MNLFRPSLDAHHPSQSGESFSEAFLYSSSRVRDALPEQHRAHFDELRKNIFAFCDEFGIPKEALRNKEAFGVELTSKRIPPQRMQEAVLLFRRFEYLVTHREPLREAPPEYLEEVERLYHLREQYMAQVDLLKQMGILHPRREQLSGRVQRLVDLFQSLFPFGKKKRPEVKEIEKPLCITGIDGKEYPLPTLGEIAMHLCEQRELFATKRDQGFTKLLLVPFGMSLDALRDILKQFLLTYKTDHPDFDLDTNDPLYTWVECYSGADIGNPPKIIYNPRFFDDNHQGQTKLEILKVQAKNPEDSFQGWRIHFLQPSDPTNQESKGFALVPREDQGQTQGKETPRPPLEAGKSPIDYLSLLKEAQDNPTSPYSHESGLTPEDWILAFITHLEETGKPLDDWKNNKESVAYLIGSFFPSIDGSAFVPYVYWGRVYRRARLSGDVPRSRFVHIGVRTSVIV